MAISWPQDTRKRFGHDTITAGHTLNNSPLFCDASLAALLDTYPRDALGIWTFAEHDEGEEAPVRGVAPDLSGEELLEAVKHGRIWLNLRAVNERVADYQATANAIFGSLDRATGQRIFKRDMGVLISSPNVHVHYHLDIPLVALFQIRGKKKLWLYPAEERFAPADRVEAITLREQEEGLNFSNAFDEAAEVITLKPGMAVTWPQTAPHRVQNGDMLNVSLSCEFMTIPALIRANAIYANGRIRRDFGGRPARASALTPTTIGKAAFARLLKRSHRSEGMETPTPASFAIDLAAERCTRPL